MQTGLAKADTRGMSRETWLQTRRMGIGGSDAGSILGVSKWSTPLSVYMDKLGLAPAKEQNEAMRQGTDLEPYVAQRFVEETGMKIRRCNKILVHPEHDWMLANIDRDIVGVDAGLECKTASPMVNVDYEGGEVPPQYYWQCVHYMAVTGASHWYLAVLILGRKFHVFDIEKNEEHIEQLIQAESNFWNNHVLAKNPPLPTGEEADVRAINILNPMVTSSDVLDLSDMNSDFEMLEYQKSAKDHIEKNISEIESRIKMRLGDHAKGTASGFKVSWSQSDRSSFDKKKLLEEHPELAPIIAQYTTTKPQRRFLVTKVG